MPKLNDPQYLLSEQYHNAEKINTRIRLHVEFSTNKYSWFPWVFDHYDLPQECRILELGCGPGNLWLENIGRIPAGWEITLSDFSPGMVRQAQQNLTDQPHPFIFEVIDAQDIPYAARHFDAVIANHCLFHMPDRAKALSEIRRVLALGGHFYATTIGDIHMQELPELVAKFDPNIDDAFAFHNQKKMFTLEKGFTQLQARFDNIKIHRYADELRVTEADALVDYVLSTVRLGLDKSRHDEFTRFVEAEMAANGGVIRIKKDSGMFEARKSIKKNATPLDGYHFQC
ncbi:MAG: class I SAM-dependent methyltransferase [Anaerolineales bacterium]|nr:class I SAM-dependent methyltransferase [Anaerolineales bacterium]